MFWRKIWLSWSGAILAIFFINTAFSSNPLIIKIDLKTEKDYQWANESGIKAYVKLDNGYIAEIEKDKIEKLVSHNISFQIVDETPWTQDYFLVSIAFSREKVNLSSYGQILLDEDDLTLLKTDQVKALELHKAGYRLNKILPQTIPLKYTPSPSPSIPALSYSQDRDSLVLLVSPDSLNSYLLKLQSYLTRFTYSDSIRKARHWIYDKFKEFGIDKVNFYPFTAWDGYIKGTWFQDSNVVAIIPGTVNPDKIIVVGGHYDSVNWDESPYDFNSPAPGADDNGSGTAATMEMARIIAEHPLSKTVIFIPFAAEELGLLGSWDYAWYAYYSGMDIQLMINFDMIAHWENTTDMAIHTDTPSHPYAQLLSQMAGLYTSLNPHILGNSSGSDSWSFSQVGYNIVYSFETIFSSHYHSASDSVVYLNIPYMSQIVKMNLATLVEVAESPGPVKGLQAWDAGDGERLYLNWSFLDENDLAGYKIYYGPQSGVYTDTHFVSSGISSDTLRNLENEETYYIAVCGVNGGGRESIYRSEITGTPRVIPMPPSGLAARTGYFKIDLSWQPNLEADLSHYNVYRSTVSGSGYDSIATGIKGLTYEDTTVEGGVWYYYCLTAVDSSGNQSSYSEEVRMIAITLDQGVLVIDESANSRGNPPSPSSDVQQDSFYTGLFSGYKASFYEYTYITDYPTMTDIGPYSTVVWLDDDYFKSNFVDDRDYELIKEYLGYGGRFILFSWTGLRYLGTLPCNFYAGDFVYDYLHINWAKENSEYDFNGGISYNPLSYPDLRVDTLKWLGSIANQGLLRYGNIFTLRGGAEPVYYYDSHLDDTVYEGKVCGMRYLGTDYKTAFFGFPLYYLEEGGAKGLVASLMRDFDEPLSVEDNPVGHTPERFILNQNYPNPFNPSTVIPYLVSGSQYLVHRPVRTTLKIYNLLGQLVRTLVDEDKLSGRYNIVWDGKDNYGREVSSGIYFYQLRTKDHTDTKKMILLR